MASTVHQTRAQERNSPSRRAGSLPARSLASVLRRLEGPIRSPFIESFLLRQIPSCFSAGPWIDTGLSCPAWAPVLLSMLPLCPGSVLFPQSRDPGRAPKCNAWCMNPRVGREKASKTMQLAKKGKFIADSSQVSCRTSNAVVRGHRTLSPSCYPIYKVCISSW